ncbi:hypothetical protein MPLA_680047 [Mesorhizobium sp. ORS 3359]|nr:hypothetical protein MPLA_680047 [Mesorhizobium sp. ORS 3359]
MKFAIAVGKRPLACQTILRPRQDRLKATLRVDDRHAGLVASDIHEILLNGAPTMQWTIYRTIEGFTPPQPSPPIRAAKSVQPLIGR